MRMSGAMRPPQGFWSNPSRVAGGGGASRSKTLRVERAPTLPEPELRPGGDARGTGQRMPRATVRQLVALRVVRQEPATRRLPLCFHAPLAVRLVR